MAQPSYLWPAVRRNLWKTLAHQLAELPFQELKDAAAIMGPFAVEMDTMPPYNKHEKLAANLLNCEIQSVQNVLAMMCEVNLDEFIQTGVMRATCNPEPARLVFLCKCVASLEQAKQRLLDVAAKCAAMTPEPRFEDAVDVPAETVCSAFERLRKESMDVEGAPVCTLFDVLQETNYIQYDISLFLKLSS